MREMGLLERILGFEKAWPDGPEFLKPDYGVNYAVKRPLLEKRIDKLSAHIQDQLAGERRVEEKWLQNDFRLGVRLQMLTLRDYGDVLGHYKFGHWIVTNAHYETDLNEYKTYYDWMVADAERRDCLLVLKADLDRLMERKAHWSEKNAKWLRGKIDQLGVVDCEAVYLPAADVVEYELMVKLLER